MNNPEKKIIPDAPALAAPSGNLLSSIAPPAELPNFITATAPVAPQSILQSVPVQAAMLPQSAASSAPTTVTAPASVAAFDAEAEKFCPAIPLSKGEPTLPIRSPEESQSPVSLPESSSSDTDKLGDIMPGSGLLTWVKGAVSSGGILQKVAEKAKSSVDSMITTLDPQMKEYLNSGGDIYIVVASDKEVKISPIREAFQAVFGKATVVGVAATSDVTAAQPVGAAAAFAGAKQRIAHVRAAAAAAAPAPALTNNTPVVAVEGYLHELLPDKWFESSLLVLSQPSLGAELHVQSQGTPVPAAAVAAMRAATPEDYPHVDTGFALTVGQVMSDNLKVAPASWQAAACSVPRAASLQLAARSLAGAYSRLLAVSAGET